MLHFNIQALDHIAIRVKDLENSAKWYGRVLGLRRLQAEQWGAYPIFMICENGTGVALFPADKPKQAPTDNDLKTDHFAFRLINKEFLNAQKYLRTQNIHFEFQDHIYFHSIYIEDPDGYKLELTTQVLELP